MVAAGAAGRVLGARLRAGVLPGTRRAVRVGGPEGVGAAVRVGRAVGVRGAVRVGRAVPARAPRLIAGAVRIGRDRRGRPAPREVARPRNRRGRPDRKGQPGHRGRRRAGRNRRAGPGGWPGRSRWRNKGQPGRAGRPDHRVGRAVRVSRAARAVAARAGRAVAGRAGLAVGLRRTVRVSRAVGAGAVAAGTGLGRVAVRAAVGVRRSGERVGRAVGVADPLLRARTPGAARSHRAARGRAGASRCCRRRARRGGRAARAARGPRASCSDPWLSGCVRNPSRPRVRPGSMRPPSGGHASHGLARGWPVERSVSSALWSSSAAAAWSTTVRRALPSRPPRRSASWARTVVNRSSTSRTGTGATRAASAAAKPRASAADFPSRPDRPVGRPTTTSMASRSAVSRASSSRSPRPRLTVATGLASRPPGSQAATPIRASPTSMASLMPGLKGSISHCAANWFRPGQISHHGHKVAATRSHSTPPLTNYIPNRRTHHAERLGDCLGRLIAERGAAALRDIVLAAAPAAQDSGGGEHELAGLAGRAARAASLRATTTVGRSAGTPATTTTPGRSAASRPRTSRATLRIPSAGRAVGHLVGHVRRAGHVLRAAGQVARVAEQRGGLEPLQVTLGVAEPGHDRGDPLGQLLAAGLELLAELADQRALAGQEAERVDADQGLHPAHPGPDRGLAQDLDQAQVARPGARGCRRTARGSSRRPRPRGPGRRTSRRTAPARPSPAPRPARCGRRGPPGH